MPNDYKILKIVSKFNYKMMKNQTKYIQDEGTDIGCEYIHASNLHGAIGILKKKFMYKQCVILQLNPHRLSKEGFNIVTTIPQSTMIGATSPIIHYHIYRGYTGQLIPEKCIEEIYNTLD
jgi:hypothetical protein